MHKHYTPNRTTPQPRLHLKYTQDDRTKTNDLPFIDYLNHEGTKITKKR